MHAIFFAVALAAGDTQPINKLVMFKETIEYYEISGRTLRELSQQMAEKGPSDDPPGGETLAATSVRFGLEAQFVDAPGGACAAEEI